MSQKVAVITGASSGIGAASARELAAAGYHVVLGARRMDRLEALASELGGTALHLDVTDKESVAAFVAAIPQCDVLLNNAGGALDLLSVEEGDESNWLRMYEMNVLSTLRVTQGLLPALKASGDGLIITIGSIASFEAYEGGGGYNAAKFAVGALVSVLRKELLGQPVRVTQIDPGMVETEFSVVRLGDQAAADAVYDGMTPLVAQDIAEMVAFVATRPSHVNIDRIVTMPRDQASAKRVHRAG
ncbi:SDR family NAD(P)-dependent oxidoreductase [Micrococcales bacterium 31B]|nr:SDR family NAD(P)-dependent oxidoreductase [Micrococcales bacterium 31B]